MHVSIISCLSFVGRLLSGIGSDYLVKQRHMSRFWCLVISSSIFAVAQFAALAVSNPYWLWTVSSISGLGYGALFGVYPALVADAFGVSGLSANWGFMTLAPVIWGNILNLLYGAVFDAHSKVLPEGDRICDQGIDCYRGAYVVTSIISVIGIFGALAAVRRDSARMKAKRTAVQGGRID
jgi:MFS family permease